MGCCVAHSCVLHFVISSQKINCIFSNSLLLCGHSDKGGNKCGEKYLFLPVSSAKTNGSARRTLTLNCKPESLG